MPRTLMTTPFGPLGIHWSDETLTGVDLDPTDPNEPSEPSDRLLEIERSDDLERSDASLARAAAGGEAVPAAILRQLLEYFRHGSARFDLPLALGGTPFQQRVWALLRTIPAGETRTYGEIARALGSAARAVGQACRANPCPIVIPCHRVVAARGLGGFAGDTSGRRLAIKRWLLHHEGITDL